MSDVRATSSAASASSGTGLLALRFGAVMLTAISQPLLSAPFSWWPLHWIAWCPFLWAIFQQEGRWRIPLALVAGTASNYMIFYWVTGMMPKFAQLPWSVAILLNVLLCMWLSVSWVMLAWLLPKLRKALPQYWVLAAPALLVAIEYAMPQLFPYMQGVSHYQVTSIFLVTSLTGVYGMSFLVFWSCCMLFHVWHCNRHQLYCPRWHITSFAVVVLLAMTYCQIRLAQYNAAKTNARKLKIGLIQSNLKPTDSLGYRARHEVYKKLSLEAVKQGADWIVWSEGEFKYTFAWSVGKRKLRRLAKTLNRPILTGGHDVRYANKRRNFTNSAVHIEPGGRFGKMHDKVLLVPFGEYMPLEKELNFIYKHIHWRSRYSPGKQMVVSRLQGVPYGFLICYEAIYPSLVRRSVRGGSRLLVNITYDAWFGKTTAPYQHLMLAAIRSAETGVPLARLATTGVTTTVDAVGRMNKLSPLFKKKVVVHTLPLVYLPSLYTAIGDLFAMLCAVCVFLIFLMAAAKRAVS